MKLVMKEAEMKYFEDYFYLRSDTHNMIWSGHKELPDHERLQKWFKENLERNDRKTFLFFSEGKIAGYLYLDDKPDKCMDIGYGVHHTYNGRGFGTEIIQRAIDHCSTHSVKCIEAWVADSNKASIRVFEKNGFHSTKEKKEVVFASSGKPEPFTKYIFPIAN